MAAIKPDLAKMGSHGRFVTWVSVRREVGEYALKKKEQETQWGARITRFGMGQAGETINGGLAVSWC